MIYTRRLAARALTPSETWIELYRPPSSGTVVIRDLVVVNATGAAIDTIALRLRPLTRAGELFFWYARSLAVGTTHLELRQVIEPTEALEGFTTAAAPNIFVTGYVFSA